MIGAAIYERMQPSRQPSWLQHAMEYRGNSTIDDDEIERIPRYVLWVSSITHYWKDCETLESGRLVMSALKRSGVAWPRRWWKLKAWTGWGITLGVPHLGAIALMRAYYGRCGMVGLVAGSDDAGRLIVLAHTPSHGIDLVPVHLDSVDQLLWPHERLAQMPQFRMNWAFTPTDES